jgi:LPXTG-site transpeptidase (sortase) family protein
VVTGANFLSSTGADIVANKIRFTGKGGATYVLTDTANVEITSGTSFTITTSATDNAALVALMDKNGTSASDAVLYNIAGLEDWNSGADPVVFIADLTGNGVTVSGADTVSPLVIGSSLVSNYSSPGPSTFTVTFSEDVNNSAGDTNANDVTNPNNYLIVKKGANGTADTLSCAGGVQSDDVKATVASVIYVNPTSTVNLASPLTAGNYRLFICGTTSITDLTGNHLGGGVDFTFDFTVTGTATASSLPLTGFTPNQITTLPVQPANSAYASLGDLWLEIPALGLKTNIVGVPQTENAWNVKWLGNDAGWLNGTAFPSWEGNSVITGHVTNANGVSGPFANIKDLQYGDQIIVHMLGQKYIFEVRITRLVRPDTTAFALEHLEKNSYLSLITCTDFDKQTNSYRFRRVVRSVLISTQSE